MAPFQSLAHTVLGILMRTFTAPARIIDRNYDPEIDLKFKDDPEARHKQAPENP